MVKVGVMRRHTLRALMLGAAGLVAAGCAVPTQQGPSTIAASHVPFGLLNPTLPTTTTTQPRLSSQVQVKIFLIGPDEALEAVERVVLIPAPLTSVITSMLAGPSQLEASQGVTTAIPNNVTVLSASTAGTVVTVNFNSAFGQITGTLAELAVAQVVYTVAAQDGLGTGVIFELDGQRTSVPVASGAEVPGPVYLAQFVTKSP
jgi:Sporulation and spore germination